MTAKDVKPTRSELQEIQKKIKLSQNGHKLLKMKRDGLILEFFKILNKAKNIREELNRAYEVAIEKSKLAMAVNGTTVLKSTSFSLSSVPTIDVINTNIMGVIVPKVNGDKINKNIYERGYGIIGTNSYIDDVAEKYELLVEKIIIAAELETSMKRLLDEIEKTKRRVNALEFKVIPELQESVTFIKLRLEEMERESITSLKKIKRKENK